MNPSAILFSAIDDPSHYWERDHRAMNRLLLLHDRLVADAVAAVGGRVLQQRDDGVSAVVPAQRALACAVDILARARAADWAPFEGFRLCLGLQEGGPEQAADAAQDLALRLQGGGILMSATLQGAQRAPLGYHYEPVGASSPWVAVLPEGASLGLLREPPEALVFRGAKRPPLSDAQRGSAAQAVHLNREAERCLRRGDPVTAARLAADAQPLWQALHDGAGEALALAWMAQASLRQGNVTQARQQVNGSLALAGESGDVGVELRALGLAADIHFSLGEIDAARGACYRALTLARREGALWAQAQACFTLGVLAELQSCYREARHYLSRASRTARALESSPVFEFNIGSLLAQVETALGRFAAAEALLEAALDPRQAPEDPAALEWPRNALAQLCVFRGDFRRAEALCESGLAAQGDGVSWYKENLCEALYAQGQTARAMELGLQCLHAAEAAGRLRGIAWGQNRLARFELAAGRHADARVRLMQAREIHGQLGEPQGLAADELGLARLERLQGDPAKAAGLAEGVASAYLSFSMPLGVALAQIELASCFLAQGDLGLALEPVALALRQAAAIGAWPVYLRALRRLAEIRAREGQAEEAAAALAAIAAHPACEAELKESVRGLLTTLGLGPRTHPAPTLDVLEAAHTLGVPIPHPSPEKQK
jgi:tetratricopeptide (TPR) repeat protein